MTSTAQPALIMNDYLMTGSIDYLDGQTDIALDGIRNKLEYFNPDVSLTCLAGRLDLFRDIEARHVMVTL